MIKDIIIGTWIYKAKKAPFGFRSGKVVFQKKNGRVDAHLKIYGLKIKTNDLKISESKISFTAGVESERLLIELELQENSLIGQVHFSEGSLDIVMSKKGYEKKDTEEAFKSDNKTLALSRKSLKEASRNLKGKEKVHTFYYGWYGNPELDGDYRGWNHSIIPHKVKTQWNDLPQHKGGDDVASNFYPELGSYSTSDKKTIETHMRQISEAGIGVAAISWWGKDSFPDKSASMILDEAQRHGLKVCFHIEPFYSSVREFKSNLEYICEMYNGHPSLFRLNGLPLYYLYNSFKLEPDEWYGLLNPHSEKTLRNTSLDGIFINLLTTQFDGEFTLRSGFDGFYTYYASDGFAYGCTTSNWPDLSAFASDNDLIYIPCAGPGYMDTRVRPWNDENTKGREKGLYYERMIKKAADSNPDFIGITSFNEWFEGTQIEPAVAKSIEEYTYENYGKDADPLFYIKKTKELVGKYIIL